MDGHRTAVILRPLGRPSGRYLLLFALAGAGILWFAQAWAHQLQHGLIVTGIGDWGTGGGIPWGMYVGSFIWWVGIAHGGIIVSAAVRLFRLDDLKSVARMAELLTLAALSMAALYIILHLGRPDRLVTSVLPALPTTIRTSPLAWDVTVITAYFVLTATYVTLTVRADLDAVGGRLPRLFRPLYRLMLVGYRPEEREKVERMAWWLALCLIILAPLFLHGGVIPWLFALLPGLPGWFGAVQGPQFLAAALTSALGAVTVLAYVFRRAYRWEEILPDRAFAALARWMGLFALLFLWLQLQQVITGAAMAPGPVAAATSAKLATPLYWVAMAMLSVVLGYVALQMLFPSLFSVGRTVTVGVMAVVAVLVEKTLFVVEGLMHPVFDLYEGVPGTYTPSWVELSSIVGALSLVVAFFLVVSKAVPLVELEEPGP
jgi:Ni/Fe-hydrogenase subunit HybB-like protein